jgi:hypothetical protein
VTTYGVWPMLVKPSLLGAVVLFVAGLAFRFTRRASLVLAIGGAFSWLFLVYVIGIAPTIACLSLSHHEALLPWIPVCSVVVLLGFLAYRVRETMLDEFSLPLDQTVGVHVSSEDETLWRENPKRDERRFVAAAISMLCVFGTTLYLLWGTPSYVFVLFVVMCHGIAILMTFGVARWFAYYIAVRRWEARCGMRLRLSALSDRDERSITGDRA